MFHVAQSGLPERWWQLWLCAEVSGVNVVVTAREIAPPLVTPGMNRVASMPTRFVAVS
jgi:hypothetical protein